MVVIPFINEGFTCSIIILMLEDYVKQLWKVCISFPLGFRGTLEDFVERFRNAEKELLTGLI
jgi:hypothetical protein